jgi:phenylacetate-CoA ligase
VDRMCCSGRDLWEGECATVPNSAAGRSPAPVPHLSAADIKRSFERDIQREGRVVHRVLDALRQYRRVGSDRQSLGRMQAERLRAILNHALTEVPAYRRLGIEKSDVDTDPLAALERFPLLERAAAQQGFVDYCSDDIDSRDCYITKTSGTSGMPLKVVHHIDHLIHYHALALRRLELRGLPHGRRILTPCQVWLEDWFEYVSPARGYSRVAEFGIREDDQQRAAMARRAREFEPEVVFAHPTHLLEFLQLLDEQRIREVRPRIVVSYGEWLRPTARQKLFEHFRAPICDLYGMREVNTIAAECPAGKYHIECERLWVEVVDKAGHVLPDGEPGEIVVTNLINTAMPLIRYRTGDIGMLTSETCRCQQPHKVLGLVAGRDPGVIRLADGDSVDVFRLSRLVRQFPVERFQVVQVSQARVEVLIRPAPLFGEDHLMSLRREVSAVLRDRIDVSVKSIDDESFIAESGRAKAVEFVSLLPAAGG